MDKSFESELKAYGDELIRLREVRELSKRNAIKAALDFLKFRNALPFAEFLQAYAKGDASYGLFSETD